MTIVKQNTSSKFEKAEFQLSDKTSQKVSGETDSGRVRQRHLGLQTEVLVVLCFIMLYVCY